jgi:diguanylate cyclase (GGDEF)-like protein
MSARARLNFFLALTCLAVYCVSSAVLYRLMIADALGEARKESTLRMEMALAIRQYTIQEVRPLLEAAGLGDRAPAVPAHAAIREMELLRDGHPEFRYREVALNPLSAANQAMGWQVDIIRAFQADPSLQEVEQVTDADAPSGPVLRIARAVRPTPDCMACHGAPEQLPRPLAAQFGEQRTPWAAGHVEAAQIVSVPMGERITRVRRIWCWYVGGLLVAFGAIFAVLNRLLKQMVVTPIERGSRRWRKAAQTDALTGVQNRRAFDADGPALLSACRAESASLSVVLIDIDWFKRINDQWGHAAGDAVLKSFAQCIRQCVKRQDGLYRIGGEEFVLLLPRTDAGGALALAARVQQAIRACHFPHAGQVTASFGVASSTDMQEPFDMLVKRADAAVYAAKAAGRDRVEMAG